MGIFSSIDSSSSSNLHSSSASTRRPLVQALLEAANPRDLVHDIRNTFGGMQSRGSSSFLSSGFDSDEEKSRTNSSAAAVSAEAALFHDGGSFVDDEESEGQR